MKKYIAGSVIKKWFQNENHTLEQNVERMKRTVAGKAEITLNTPGPIVRMIKLESKETHTWIQTQAQIQFQS